MNTIQAIETHYNGYRFRSRLEARWAVFFDALGVEFKYEPEGYKLPGGAWYLPDLFLPKVRMWAEIKPVEFTPVEKDKCKELVDNTGHPCLLLVGPPEFTTYHAVHSLDAEPGVEIGGARYECDYLLDIDYHGRKHYEREHRLYGGTGEQWEECMFTPEYRSAVHLARSERFAERTA